MLRSLDPHSNYYDREEYEELKTDQRSEYFGIGASIQNYTIGKDYRHIYHSDFRRLPGEPRRLALWRSGYGCRRRQDDGQDLR